MKRPPIAIVCLALAFGLAADASAQKNQSTCGPDEYLNMQIFGTPSAPGYHVLVSDGNEYYNHGASRNLVVRFQVDNCTFDFTPNLNRSTRSMLALLSQESGGNTASHFLNFDRVRSVPVTPEGLSTDAARRAAWLGSAFCANGVQKTTDGKIAKNVDGHYQDNYAGCGIDASGNAFVWRAGGASLDGDKVLTFNVSPIDRPAVCANGADNPKQCAASHLRVYHPSDTQWIVRADASTLASYRVWVGGKTAAYVHQRYENVPLEIIVTKQ